MHTRTGKLALYSISYHGERVSLLEGLEPQKRCSADCAQTGDNYVQMQIYKLTWFPK